MAYFMSDIHDFDDNQIFWKFAEMVLCPSIPLQKFFSAPGIPHDSVLWTTFFGWPHIWFSSKSYRLDITNAISTWKIRIRDQSFFAKRNSSFIVVYVLSFPFSARSSFYLLFFFISMEHYLDASSHLCKRACLSVHRSVRNAFLFNSRKRRFSTKYASSRW